MNKKEINREYHEELRAYRSELQIHKTEYKRCRDAAKERRRAALEEYKRERAHPNDPPRRKIIDEVGNAVTHGIGALISPVLYVLMLLNSHGVWDYIGATIYFMGLFLMFLSSCLYHSFAHGSAVKRLFHRFDYCSIYLLIGATFAPILLSHIGGALGIIFFAVQWAIIITAITLTAVFGPKKLRKVSTPIYLLLGWSGAMLIPQLLTGGIDFPIWIIGGGVVFSLGVIPFAIKRGPAHFIWHIFVLAGALVHWLGIFLNVYM